MLKKAFNYKLVNKERIKLGITHKYLANYLTENGEKISEQGVKNWFLSDVDRRTAPEMPKLILLGKLLKLEPNEMLLSGNEAQQITFNYYPDIAASAGYGLINAESKPEVFKVGEEFAKKVLQIDNGKQFDLIRVKGNSMSPLINSGDFVVIDRRIKHLEQVKNGNVIIFRKDDELYCKRFKKDPNDGTLYMQSENNEYKELKIKKFNDFALIGKVITKLSIETFETMFEVVKS